MSIGARIAANRQSNRRQVAVKEWGEDDKPLQIFAGVLTCHDVDRLQRKHKDFLANMSIEAMVDLIILKSENEAGERLFTLEDKPILMREPVLMVTRIAGEIFGSVLSMEDAEKN
jgi:hypothetical protein